MNFQDRLHFVDTDSLCYSCQIPSGLGRLIELCDCDQLTINYFGTLQETLPYCINKILSTGICYCVMLGYTNIDQHWSTPRPDLYTAVCASKLTKLNL